MYIKERDSACNLLLQCVNPVIANIRLFGNTVINCVAMLHLHNQAKSKQQKISLSY